MWYYKIIGNINTQQVYFISYHLISYYRYALFIGLSWIMIHMFEMTLSWIYNSSNWQYIYEFLDDMNLRFKIYVLSHHNKLWNQHSPNHFLRHGNYFLEILPKHRGQNCLNMSSRSFPRPEAGHRCIYDGESAVCKSSKTHSMMKV